MVAAWVLLSCPIVAPAEEPAGGAPADAQLPSLDARVKKLEERLGEPSPAAAPAGLVRAPLVERIDLGGQVRLRYEARAAADYRLPGTFGRPAAERVEESDDMALERIRLQADVHVDPTVRAFIQIQDARTFGQEASVVANDSNIGLHQGYLEVRELLAPPLSLRVGRQELTYGDQRLVSPLDWHNVGRAFDAALVRWKEGAWSADLFSAIVLDGTTAHHDRNFYGLYASCAAVEAHAFDAYVFHRRFTDQSAVSEAGQPGNLIDTTVGLRAAGKPAPFDYGVEGAFQFGAGSRDPIRAAAAAATAGYTVDASWQPRVGVEFTYATGDDDPADGRRRSFDPLFPFGHAFQGFLDIFSWRNGADAALKLSARPTDRIQIGLDVHGFWLAAAEDAWTGAAVTPIRRDPTGAAGRSIGLEIDAHLRWKVHERIGLWTGYSRFHPGGFVRHTGPAPPMDWFFLQATLDF